jgi:N-acyl-D-aspartate/D-glutamate deacylase
MHDLLIKGGTLVDGTGARSRPADVAIDGGRIAAIGLGLGEARETIDATGLIVTPGFIDPHTHYDGQATWDDKLEPAVWHGVSTVIMGNCGVGFAPVRPGAHGYLIDMMASVEDIPAASMEAAIPWNWRSYPDYLAAIAAKPRTIDVASMIPHAVLRAFVMGAERAADTPTDGELSEMALLVREGMRAGAVGLSTSRTILHTTGDGSILPGTFAGEDELVTLAAAVREGGGGTRGVLEVSPASTAFPEPTGYVEDVDLLIRVARRSGCAIVFSLLQSNHAPDDYRAILDRVERATAEGLLIYPEVGTRPISALMTFMGASNPFHSLPSYAPLREMGFAERVAALSDPVLRRRLIAEENPNRTGLELLFTDPELWSKTAPLRRPADYYSPLEHSVQAIADRQGVRPEAVAYDAMMENGGRGILMYAVCNWARRTRDTLHEMVTHPSTIVGLGDGGAHLSATVDVSQPTTFLADWVRDRGAADRYGMSLEAAIRKLTLDNAAAFGLTDRGVIAPGKRADVNVIDLARLGVEMPVMVYDLPLGGGRLDQRATGYVATLVAGEVVQRDGVLTGNLPGTLAPGGR